MILHITNDYANTPVYKNLIINLDANSIEQIVYTPVKSEKSIGNNWVELREKKSNIIYSNILNLHTDRVLFNIKVSKIYKDIQAKVDINNIKLIHAHTWFSNGAVALKLYKEYGTPFIISVRSADLNQFWKLPHLKTIGIEILKNAKHIIFINPSYQERFTEIKRIKNLEDSISEKSTVIPNGIDPFWIDNVQSKRTQLSKPIKLLYIGQFTKRKNVVKLIKSIQKLIEQGVQCEMTLIGGAGNQNKKVLSLIENDPNFNYIGRINNKNELKRVLQRSDIFTMTSLKETFGLVYGEALSQGIPVLYTINEGIDGVFEKTIGVGVNPHSIDSICAGIRKIINEYDKFDFIPNQIVEKLDWKNITVKYLKVYESVSKT